MEVQESEVDGWPTMLITVDSDDVLAFIRMGRIETVHNTSKVVVQLSKA